MNSTSLSTLLFWLGAVLLTTQAFAQNVPPPGDSIQTVEVNGVKRVYRLHIPKGYDGENAVPLVLCLHGRGGNGMGMEKGTGWGLKADQEDFVAVFPNGLGHPQAWNGGINSTITGNANDVGFIQVLLDKLESNLNIDKHRVYCCGMSSGAIMTGRCGVELTDRFAALGIAAGTVGATQPDGSQKEIPPPPHPISVIIFHGKKDGTVRFNGGGPVLNAFPVSRSIAFWTKADGCGAPERRNLKPNTTVDDYHGKDNSEVVLYVFANGGHVWPTVQNDGMSATDVMWDFFAKHPKE